jgi:hypothetical protein
MGIELGMGVGVSEKERVRVVLYLGSRIEYLYLSSHHCVLGDKGL